MKSNHRTGGAPAVVRQPVRLWVLLLGVWILAVCVRCIYLWQIRSAPFFDLRFGDAAAYHEWARRIAGGDWLGQGVFYQAPLYPYFLAAVYRVFGDSVATVRLVQGVMGGFSCALLSAAGVSLFGSRGVIAGVLLAVYPPAIFLDGLLEKSALVTFLMTALLALLAGAQATWRRWLAAGAALGLLVLARENALILLAPILLWIGLGFRPRWKPAAAVVAGCALVLLPVAIRNRAVGGEFALTTAQFGPNFYIGNHAGADGTYQALVVGHGNAADEREDATRVAEQAAGRRLSSGEVSGYWTQRALEDMRSQPANWLALMARKIALTCNAAEISDTESQQVFEEHSWLLRALGPFDFGLLLGLAAMGAALTMASWRRLWWLYALIGTYAFSVALFYVFARYRFPMAPAMMVLAAGTTAADLRLHKIKALVVAAAAIGFAYLPLDNPRAARATNYFDIASALSTDAARSGAAMDFYQRALDTDPQFPAAQFGLATLLARQGRPAEAIPHYRAAIATWPDYAEARYNLGAALAATGREEEAADEFAEALRLRPDDPDAYAARAKALLALNRPAEAIEQYGKALALQPKNAAALVGMGVALAQSGHASEATEKFRLALEIDPRNAAAQNSLGTTLASQGRIVEALPHFERAVELNPGDENARRNLDAARQMMPRR